MNRIEKFMIWSIALLFAGTILYLMARSQREFDNGRDRCVLKYHAHCEVTRINGNEEWVPMNGKPE